MALVGGAGTAPAGSAYATELPGASGDTARPNYVGPSGNGQVERMKAGESPWDQGRSVKAAPVRFQKAVPRSKENASGAPRGAPVRVMDRQFPPAGGTGLAARQANGSAFRPANFGAPLPSFWECEGFDQNLERKPAGMRRAATLPHGSTHERRKLRCRNLRT